MLTHLLPSPTLKVNLSITFGWAIRRRVRGLMNRVVGMVALMEPTFSIEALIEVLFDRVRPLWIPAGCNVIWNGPRNFRDDDVLDTQVEFAMRACNLQLHFRLSLTSTFGNYDRTVLTDSTKAALLVHFKSTDACIFSLPRLRVRCRQTGMNTISDHLIVESPSFWAVLVDNSDPRLIVAGSITGSLTVGVSQRSYLDSKNQADVPFT